MRLQRISRRERARIWRALIVLNIRPSASQPSRPSNLPDMARPKMPPATRARAAGVSPNSAAYRIMSFAAFSDPQQGVLRRTAGPWPR
jgi:hypothetical protein